MTNKTYKILGFLLTYPNVALIASLDAFTTEIREEALLSEVHIKSIEVLAEHLRTTDLITLQEEYVGLFDSRRLLSLYVFEHIHGDNRDRGQAMVDLTERYKELDLFLENNELPDFFPVLLEFLSKLSNKEALEMLDGIIDIVAMLACRLEKHESPYQNIFHALLSLSDAKPDEMLIQKETENYDEKQVDKAEIDKKWKEPQVFGKEGC